DRPVLYAWSLYYLGLEVWRDDFVWPGKIADHRGLNFTGNALEVNLTSMSGAGGGSYEEFPTIVCSGEYPGVDVFYANAQLDGYEDRSIVNLGAWSNSMTYDDLNGDGEIDLVVAQSSNTKIYLNKGEGSFVDSTDITIPMGGSRVSTGDLDGDGYYDILVSVSGDAKVFMGGDGGPDTTADITFTTSNCGDTLIEDVDGDGHLDVILGERNGGKANVYLGSRSGPDTTADHTLTVLGDVGACEAGDLNGDGYTDLIYYTGSPSSYRMEIFEGGPTGWSDSRKHTDITHDNSGDALCVADLDKDGYEDLLQIQSVGGSSYNLKIWFGDNSWPSTPDISKTTGYDNSVVAMVPKGSGVSRAYRGTLTTEPITLPSPYEQKWDMLDLVGSMPMNTTMTVSVLDAVTEDPIAG
ncbi:MAG: VCBS repeat-containing protein, partial [Thermoplasmata archaeon]|nr:VCBS repeat-containing protein [Thermoplasmata archaeon]